MTHLNSAVKLLDRAAEKFNDKIAISDEWSEISFSELQRKGKAVGTALAKTTPQGYMPAPVMVYLKKSISCLVCFMGAMYSANPYVPTAYDMPANRIQKIVDSLQGRGHIADGVQTHGEHGGPGAQCGSGVGRFDAGMPGTDHNDIIIS